MHHNQGYTFLGLLLVIMLTGLTLAEAGNLWSQARQREKEQELLRIGSKFQQAIRDYYLATPGPVKEYPKTLAVLLRDDRFTKPQRYLRKIYLDPITQRIGWGIAAAPDGGIMGVFSLSSEKPFKTRNFPIEYKQFEDKSSYAEWVFAYGMEMEKLSTRQQQSD